MTKNHHSGEELQNVLARIQRRKGCTLIEAFLVLAEVSGKEIEDLMANVDDALKTRLQNEAIDQRMVRQCVFQTSTGTLDF